VVSGIGVGITGGASLGRIARYDGAAWTGFGAGLEAGARALTTRAAGGVTSLLASDDTPYAEGRVSARLAVWTPGASPIVAGPGPDQSTCATTQTLSFSISTAASRTPAYRWRKDSVPLSDGPAPDESMI